MKCNNCGDDQPPARGLVVMYDDQVVSVICRRCSDGVAVGAIGLRRGPDDKFTYSQWSPLATIEQTRPANRR